MSASALTVRPPAAVAPVLALTLGLTLSLAGCGRPAAQPVLRVGPDAPLTAAPGPAPTSPGALQRALSTTRGPVRLVLEPGRYRLAPAPYADPSCGNCADPDASVPGTVGLLVQGSGIVIEGSHRDSVVIETHAGYGILFDGCVDCGLRGVTVTGGERDPDGRATNGGVVVRRGRVTVEACRIADNIGDAETVASVVVGIAGVVGREGSDIRLHDCLIERNSWDGVALYRGARAEIRDNVVDGVDKAAGGVVGGGRGVGIGVTWDAVAVVERNLVRRYWKGIGTFVDARAEVRHNVVEDILTWGLAYWGPDGSRPSALFEENAVYLTGACGVSVERVAADGPPPGGLVGNLFARTNQDPRYDDGEPYCPQRPIARTAVPPGFVIRDNRVHAARQPGAAPAEPMLDLAAFQAAAAPLLARLRAQPATAGSRFVRELGGRRSGGVDGEAADPGAGSGLVLLVRHAQAARAPGESDPPLGDVGLARAERLAAVLRDVGLDAIHTTDTRRTRATAAPIAAAAGLTPVVYDPRALDELAERLVRAGGRQLVVGHSNTTPELVRLLGGDPVSDIADTEYDRLYVVVLGGVDPGRPPRTLLLRY